MFGQALKQTHPPHAAAITAREDQMIEYGEVYNVTGPSQSTRGAIIRVARSGIAAGVVMGDNYPGAAELQRVGDNLADRQSDLGWLAGILLDMEAMGGAVDMCDH